MIAFIWGTLLSFFILLIGCAVYGRLVSQKIQKREKKVDDNAILLKSLSETMNSMANAFRLISAAEQEGSGFSDYSMEQAAFDRKEFIDGLFKKIFPEGVSGNREKDANAIYTACLNMMSDLEFTSGLQTSSVNAKKVIHRGGTLILEGLCRRAGIPTKHQFFWDLKNQAFWVESEFPAGAEKPLSIISGKKPGRAVSLRFLTVSSGNHTVVFPLKFDLMSSRDLFPTGKSMEVPVGGYYVHSFSVYAKGSWELEYVFPKTADLDQINLKAFAMTPSVTVGKKFPGGNRIVFEIERPGGMNEDQLMVYGDSAAVPLLITARLR